MKGQSKNKTSPSGAITETDSFFTHELTVGNIGDEEVKDLGPGEYQYSFQWHLPENLPSTFIGEDDCK